MRPWDDLAPGSEHNTCSQTDPFTEFSLQRPVMCAHFDEDGCSNEGVVQQQHMHLDNHIQWI